MGQVLPHGHQLDAVGGTCGRQAVEFGQGRDMCRLIEHDQERWIQRLARPGCLGERVRQDLLGQRSEVAPQPALIMRRCTQVEGVAASKELGRFECIATRLTSGEGRKNGLGRGVHRAARAFIAAPRGAGGIERFGHSRLFEDGRHLAGLLRVDPTNDVGHGTTVVRRRKEQRGQELGRGGVPELPVGGGAVGLGRLRQVGGYPVGAGPICAKGEGRPRARTRPDRSGGVDAPDAPPVVALLLGGT